MIVELKNKLPSILLWIVASWLTMFFFWTVKRCNDAISFAIATGQVSVRDNLYDVMSFYMESGAHYLVYALLLTAVGILLWRRQTIVGDEYGYVSNAAGAELVPDEIGMVLEEVASVSDETEYIIEFEDVYEDDEAGADEDIEVDIEVDDVETGEAEADVDDDAIDAAAEVTD